MRYVTNPTEFDNFWHYGKLKTTFKKCIIRTCCSIAPKIMPLSFFSYFGKNPVVSPVKLKSCCFNESCYLCIPMSFLIAWMTWRSHLWGKRGRSIKEQSQLDVHLSWTCQQWQVSDCDLSSDLFNKYRDNKWIWQWWGRAEWNYLWRLDGLSQQQLCKLARGLHTWDRRLYVSPAFSAGAWLSCQLCDEDSVAE